MTADNLPGLEEGSMRWESFARQLLEPADHWLRWLQNWQPGPEVLVQ